MEEALEGKKKDVFEEKEKANWRQRRTRPI